MRKIEIPQEILKEKYLLRGMTAVEIAAELGVGTMTISRKLKEYGLFKKEKFVSEYNPEKTQKWRLRDLFPTEEDVSGQILYGRKFISPVMSEKIKGRYWLTSCSVCGKIVVNRLDYFEKHPCRCSRKGKNASNSFIEEFYQNERVLRMFDENGHSCLIDPGFLEEAQKYYWYRQDNDGAYWRTIFTPLKSQATQEVHYLAREVYSFFSGRSIENKVVDHINHDKDDNRKSNLRLCTLTQNNWNSLNPRRANLPIGVFKRGRYFYSVLFRNKKKFQLGKFLFPEEAGDQYSYWAMKLSGDYACVSFSEKYKKFLKRIIIIQTPSDKIEKELSRTFPGIIVNIKEYTNTEEDLISYISDNYGQTEYYAFLVQNQQKVNKILRALRGFKSLLKVFTHSSLPLNVEAPLSVESFNTFEELQEKIAIILTSEKIVEVQERR